MSLVFLDTETTGLDPQIHDVWEIAYAVDGGPIRAGIVHHSLVGADPKALELNGYWSRPDELFDRRTAFSFEQDVRAALEGNTLVAANPAFDAKFLQARWGVAPWKYRLLDLEAYALPLLQLDGHEAPVGLAKIAERLGVTAPDHSARADVLTLRECFYRLRDYYGSRL